MHYIQYPFFENNKVISFTSTRHGGVSENTYQSLNLGLHTGDDENAVLENRKRFSQAINIPLTQMVMAQQMHTDTVYKVTKQDAGRGALRYSESIPKTDALITNERELCITIQTADCVPVLLFDPINKAIGVVHAGWRGTVHNITGQTIKAMQTHFNCNAANIKAIIGPSISPDNYEVGDELLQAANRAFGEKANECIVQQNNKSHFNLWQANKLQLIDSGLISENIQLSNLCTYANPDFFSARKEGIYSGRIMSGLMLL